MDYVKEASPQPRTGITPAASVELGVLAMIAFLALCGSLAVRLINWLL